MTNEEIAALEKQVETLQRKLNTARKATSQIVECEEAEKRMDADCNLEVHLDSRRGRYIVFRYQDSSGDWLHINIEPEDENAIRLVVSSFLKNATERAKRTIEFLQPGLSACN